MVQPDSKKKKKYKKKTSYGSSNNNNNNNNTSKNEPPTKKQTTAKEPLLSVKPETPADNFLQKFGLRQKSKTFIDLPPKSGGEDDVFERRPSSFRKKINTFLQNSTILQRPLLRRSGSMKQGINSVNGSTESLAIQEDKVLVLRPWENRVDLATRREKCRSLDNRNSLRSLTEETTDCPDLRHKQENGGDKERSLSLSAGLLLVPTWLLGGKAFSTRFQSTTDLSSEQEPLDQTRSRSLTHIDQLETGSERLFGGMGDRPTDVAVSHSKRPTLTRSEAQTCECFSVGFEGLLEDTPDEYVQVSNEIVLKDALLEVCKRKSVDLSLSSVFLDVNKSPLPCLDIDTAWMGGKHIRIKVNDRVVRWDAKGNSTPIRKTTSGHKSGKGTLRTQNPSSEEPSVAEVSARSKRWSGFFGTSRDNTRMENLVELLDMYLKSGIPGAQDASVSQEIYQLESDWKSIVKIASNLDERQSQQQEAIWELICSELEYIRMLRVVCHLFLSCLVNLQTSQLLLEIDNNKLFSNVVEICKCNENFWRQTIYPLLEESRSTGEPLNPELLRDGFGRFGSSFECYKTYCVQQGSCQRYCRDRMTLEQDHELFTAYLAWCETQKECNRLKLLDILVKPMQRLTKYSLLLKAVLKHTTSSSQQQALQFMIRQVDDFVNHVNSTLQQQQDLQKLRQLAPKLENYEVEIKDEDLGALLHKHSTLYLTDCIPNTSRHRALIHESDLKFKDSGAYKMEVHCFLLTDMLLITKPVKKLGESKVRYKMIRQPYAVDHLVVQDLARDTPTVGCVYLNQFNTAVNAFFVSSSEPDVIKNWLDALKKARSQLAQITNQPQAVSRQHSEDVAPIDQSDELKPSWACPSPRDGSRVSSLVHSHSGSMDMTENISSMSSVSRGISVENTSEQRGSSLSSEDGNPSPRPRRSPNTLTVHTTHLGQSLPNLTIASTSPNSPRAPNSLYLAPPKALSPTHRGVTYPPPSPPRLQRGIAIAPRNPPLLKTSRVELSRSLSIAHENKMATRLSRPETKTKDSAKATASGGTHLTVSSSQPSSTGSSDGVTSAVKFGEILEMVRLEADKSPLELFESKVEQWRRYGFTGGGEETTPMPAVVATTSVQRSHSEESSRIDPKATKRKQSRRCSSL